MASSGSVKQLYIAIAHLVYVETQMARDRCLPFDESDDTELLAQADRVVEFAKDVRLQSPSVLNQGKVHEAKNKVSKAQIYFYEINNSNQTGLSKNDVFSAVIEVIAALADLLSDMRGEHTPSLTELEALHDEVGNKDMSGSAAIGVDKLLH